MKIDSGTKVNEVYSWSFTEGLTEAHVWSAALRQVAAYWEENPQLGTPSRVAMRLDMVFNEPNRLMMEVEWSQLATSTNG